MISYITSAVRKWHRQAAGAALTLQVATCSAALSPDQIAQIQADAVAACGFLPTAIQIAETIPQTAAGAIVAQPIANAICALVTGKSARRTVGVQQAYHVTTVVGGQPLHITVSGHFVGNAERSAVLRRAPFH